jgi:metal-responsive CopG/Arc/MetJ family transcriptional regulator
MYPGVIHWDMPQTTIRLPEELLEKIDSDTEEEESRSEWIRQACRERLSEEDLPDRVDDLETRVDELEETVEEPLLGRLFG